MVCHRPTQELKIRIRTFSRATKQVIVELIPMADEYQLLACLKEESVVSPKKTPEKGGSKEEEGF